MCSSGGYWETFQKLSVISNEMLMPMSPLEASPHGACSHVCPAETAQIQDPAAALRVDSVPSQWHTVWLQPHAGSQLPCVAWVSSLTPTLPVPAGKIWQPCSSGDCVSEEGVIQEQTQKGNQVFAGLSPESQPGHSCNDRTWLENYCLWAGCKDLIQKVPHLSGHSSPFWLKVAPSQWLEDKEVFC